MVRTRFTSPKVARNAFSKAVIKCKKRFT
jgi:hypothetical protein